MYLKHGTFFSGKGKLFGKESLEHVVYCIICNLWQRETSIVCVNWQIQIIVCSDYLDAKICAMIINVPLLLVPIFDKSSDDRFLVITVCCLIFYRIKCQRQRWPICKHFKILPCQYQEETSQEAHISYDSSVTILIPI